MQFNTLEDLSMVLPQIYRVGHSCFGLDKLLPKALIQNGWKRIPFTEFNPMLLSDGSYAISSKDTNSKFNGTDDFSVIMFKREGIYVFALMIHEDQSYQSAPGYVWEWFSNGTDDEEIRKVIGHYTQRPIKGYNHFKALKTTFDFASYSGRKQLSMFMMVCDIDESTRHELLTTMDAVEGLPLDGREDYTKGLFKTQTEVHRTIMFMGEGNKGFALIAMKDREDGEHFNKLGVTADCEVKDSLLETIENIIQRPTTDLEKNILNLFKNIKRFQHITSF